MSARTTGQFRLEERVGKEDNKFKVLLSPGNDPAKAIPWSGRLKEMNGNYNDSTRLWYFFPREGHYIVGLDDLIQEMNTSNPPPIRYKKAKRAASASSVRTLEEPGKQYFTWEVVANRKKSNIENVEFGAATISYNNTYVKDGKSMQTLLYLVDQPVVGWNCHVEYTENGESREWVLTVVEFSGGKFKGVDDEDNSYTFFLSGGRWMHPSILNREYKLHFAKRSSGREEEEEEQ